MNVAFESLLRDALTAQLGADPMLALQLSRIGDGEGESAAVPYAQIGEISGTDWGAKALPGREARAQISIVDRGDGARIATLALAAERAVAALPRFIGGWETSGVTILRTRAGRAKNGTRFHIIDARVRALAPALTPAP